MLGKVRYSTPEARLRIIVALGLVVFASALGYVEKHPQQTGVAAPKLLQTSAEVASSCGRLSLYGSGNTCGGKVRGITFMSATK